MQTSEFRYEQNEETTIDLDSLDIASDVNREQNEQSTINLDSLDAASTVNREIKQGNYYKPCTINFALTNARSLTPKVDSMI